MSKARDLADLGSVTARLDEVGNSDGALSNRNLIINGAMQVAQRGTTGTSTGGGYLSVDRYSYVRSGYTPSMTRSQEVDGPAGFSNSYKALTATAAAVPVGGYASIYQTIEAQNLQHLNYGSADAATITLSFWVKSNVTGTFAVSAVTFDTSIMYNSLTYTVSSANTWEYKTVTFAGQTVNAIDNDNGAGLRIEWCLSSGTDYTSGSNGVWSTSAPNRFAGHATDITGTLNNYLAITGVQLEVGDTATPFEHRSYGAELALCQRYFYRLPCDNAFSNAEVENTTGARGVIQFPTSMRTGPSMSYLSVGDFALRSGGAGYTLTSLTLGYTTTDNFRFNAGVASGLTAGRAGYLYGGLGDSINFDAEL